MNRFISKLEGILKKRLTERQLRIYNYLAERKIKRKILAKKLKVSLGTVYRDIRIIRKTFKKTWEELRD